MSLTIERLGHRGDGIAPGPVFVSLTLPGEVVEGDVSGDRIAAPRIVTPSADRVKAPCRHFRQCGGCALQHASDGFVAAWKADVVRTALAAQGLEAPVRGIATSPPASRRRAVLSARRTKSGALIGFHARASDALVDTPDCLLLSPRIMALRPALERLLALGGSRKAELSVTVTETETGADVRVTGGKPADAAMRADLAAIGADAGLARLTWEDEQIATHVAPVVRFDGIAVVPPPGAFLQATAEGEAALRRSVAEAVGDAARVVDLFAGCGTFSLPLARGAEVLAVEAEDAMLHALDAGWRRATGLRRVTTLRRDLFRQPLLAAELQGFGAAVIDPPRAGAAAQVQALAGASIPRIAFVSCNPVTFARDARTLVDAGFGLDWIDVVDQFRWSPHVELAAQFTRGHMPV
ncbi:MAG: class I SAM-dependent RNA methyltransferase [Paracoccaceae bacterium]